MRTKLYFKLSPVLSLILLICTSCISDVDLSNISKNVKIDQSLGIPVSEANMTIKDLLTKFGLPSNIDTLSNEIFYQANITGEYNFHPINLADSLKPYSKEIAPKTKTITYPPNTAITIASVTDFLGLGVNSNIIEQRIDLIKIKSSLLDVTVDVSNDLKMIPASAFTVEFDFPRDKLLIDDPMNKLTFTPTNFGQTGQVSVGSYSIFAAGNTTIPFQINVYIKPQNTPITISPDSKIFLNVNFSKIDFDAAWGLFKMEVVKKEKLSLPFDLENYLPNSFLRFDNPTVDVHSSTNIGADIAFNLDSLNLYNSSTPSNLYKAWFNNHTSNTTSNSLSGPTVLGQWTSTDFTQLNKTNGETNQLFDKKPYPNTIDFQYSLLNSPLSTTRPQNFISFDSKITFDIKMKMKMSFKGGSYYTGIDTIKNVGSTFGTILEGVDSAVLVLKFANQIPVKALYRMTFWKSNAPNDTIAGTITKIKNDSTKGNIFSQFQINAPQINADGSVMAGVVNSQTILIGVNKKTIENLKKTSFIVFKIQLGSETVGGVANPIHFTTKNSFGVKLGIFLKPNTTVNIGKTN